MDFPHYPAVPDPSRRRFVQGLAWGSAAFALGLMEPGRAWASPGTTRATPLTGDTFDLAIGETPVNYTGRARAATTINGGLPGPLLRWKQGETVTMRVTNRLRVPSSIHWHGIILPANMDGVPGLSYEGIAPGETFVYRFPVNQAGTYWYHSHSGFQEQTGVYGPLVIDPTGAPRFAADREHVVMLSDWTDEDPEHIFATLKRESDYYNPARPTVGDFMRAARANGLASTFKSYRMWNHMRMSQADLSDVSGVTYTYLMNGSAPNGNWTGMFRPGEKVRLRFINGSASTIFDVRIPGLKMTVIAADGQDVDPVTVDEFRISVAETYDVLVEPDDGAYTVFAQSIDRTGYARGTLAPREGMIAAVPAMDARVWLPMSDMMGAPHHAMPTGGSMPMHDMPMHDMSHGMPMGDAAASRLPPKVRHARTEYGPGTDMHVDTPRTNLDDPGVGLRGNGRRVLTYADLHSVVPPADTREPGREIELHLTGNMERFMWSFDGVKYSDSTPVHFRHGERLRIVLVNDTMMTHPVHLHGMWSDLENEEGQFQVRKHTINVQPAQRVTYAVTADAPGRWAYHCHLLYHMEAGMFREVVVS